MRQFRISSWHKDRMQTTPPPHNMLVIKTKVWNFLPGHTTMKSPEAGFSSRNTNQSESALHSENKRRSPTRVDPGADECLTRNTSQKD